ncbi:MAG TPA: hypothetical protein VFD58_10955, partial [Blastocatellia bacterium]|nr:hypothetical protein [Blastocatellia bacterium]
MNRKPTFFRRTLAVALMIAVGSFQLLLTTSATAQTVQSGQFLSGELSVTGDVTINGVKAMPGDTVMNNTIIKTGCSGTAAVNIGQLGRIELGPGSEMTMNLSPEAIGGSLSAGSATISTPAGVAFSVVTPDGV